MTFENFIKKISPKLKKITSGLIGYDRFLSNDDLFQEALLHLWLSYKKGKFNNKTDSYILRSCYFFLRNYIRKNPVKLRSISLEQEKTNKKISLENRLITENEQDFTEETHTKLIIDEIKNNGLTEKEKEIFCLSLEGFTVREIGEKLGISHVRVVKLKKRIKNKCVKYF